ncbi:MAG: DUF5317 domain-containing protein [Acidimicrobiia bacterium]
MILLAAVALVALTVPVAGGRFRGFLNLRLRSTWLVSVALATQMLVIRVIPRSVGDVPARALHLASYALLAAFLFRNRKVPGLLVLVVGGLMNLAAIAANGGVMPASRTALAVAGQAVPEAGRFANSGKVDDTRLLLLGDVLAWPDPLPLHNVLSIGDLVLVGGAAVMFHELSRSRWSSRPAPGVDQRSAEREPAFAPH